MCEICVADATVGALAAGTAGGTLWYARYKLRAGAMKLKAWVRANVLKLA